MAIDLLVLGLDGVLFDTEAAHLQSSNHALAQCGSGDRLSLDWYRNAALLHGAGNALTGLAHGADAATLSGTKEQQFHEIACQGRIALQPGCTDLIGEALDEGCKLAIVTAVPARTATVLLEQAFGDRMTEMFAAIASSASIDSSSDNNAYHLVLRTVGVDPWRSVAIDVSTPALLAARRAGFWTLAATPDIEGLESVDGSDAWHPELRIAAYSRHMANPGDSGRRRFISFDALDALKNASRMSPSFAGRAAAAWA